MQYASQILDLVNRSEEEVRIRKEGLQGTLYIASVEGCGPHLFAHWISEFQKMHPHVQYILWNGNTDDVNNRVAKGLCEVAMITAPFNTEEFHVLEVYDEPWGGDDSERSSALFRDKLSRSIQMNCFHMIF